MIPFNKPFFTGRELGFIKDAHERGMLAGNGYYSKKCIDYIENELNCPKVLLTHSCTAALEMSAILLDIKTGDEVIMPSYTFVSTANAFAMHGAIPVFVDIENESMNISVERIENAITSKTKAIVAVHYAGHSCDMKGIMELADRHCLKVVEDAAQAFLAKSASGKYLGTIGHYGCISFHETKNIISGEGGCLIINDPKMAHLADVVHEKGTDRSLFLQGLVDKYSWRAIGSSYAPSEVTAAFLYAQLLESRKITKMRKHLWSIYDNAFKSHISDLVELPKVDLSEDNENAHIFFIKLKDREYRSKMISLCSELGIQTVFHYVPLHSSSAGIKFCRAHGNMQNTINESSRLLRLPLWIGVNSDQVIETVIKVVKHLS